MLIIRVLNGYAAFQCFYVVLLLLWNLLEFIFKCSLNTAYLYILSQGKGIISAVVVVSGQAEKGLAEFETNGIL